MKTIKCTHCGKIILKYNKKFCDRDCYFKSDQFKKHIYNNGKSRAGIKKVEYRMSHGYKYIYKPEHPSANDGLYVAEHRFVMEQKIGRYLKQNEVVHHRDGNKQNNNIKNLELLRREDHSRRHAKHCIAITNKLNKNEVISIYNSKLKNKELAEIYKVNKITIWNIKTKRTWKWIH
jgi:hypothetical protein